MKWLTPTSVRSSMSCELKYVRTDEDREHYERTIRTVILIRKLLMTIDSERQRAGISKAELARRIGADPSVVRRLFSREPSNPTLKTVLDLLAALNIDVELKRSDPTAPTEETGASKPRKSSARKRAA